MRLFDFIETLVQWESTTDEAVLNTARELILIATEGSPPPLLDPFAGGGSIPLEAQRLGLEAQQRKQVASNLKRTEETVQVRLQETYSWLLVPVQLDATGPVEIQAFRISGQDNLYERALRKLRQGEQLISKWSPDNLRIELDAYLWRDQPHVSIKQLWDYFARYCYLSRLVDQEVLTEAIQEGVGRLDAPFGYATMVAQDGSYKGLAYQQLTGSIYFDENSVIVRPEIAAAQLTIKHPPPRIQDPPPGTPPGEDPRSPVPSAPTRVTSRYHGTITLDPQRANKDMATIVEEIVQRLTSLTGTDVEITVEISAYRSSGFDENTVRTISENSRTLKFTNHGFEEE